MPESIDTSLVRIHTKAGGVAGAGFLIGQRHILTCAHVIAQALGLADDAPDQPASTISLDFPQLASHTLLSAEVVFWDPVQADGRGDIAGLKLLDEPPVGAEAVHFALAEQVWEHPYRAFGFPAGLDDGVWSGGRLKGRQGTNWIQLEDDKIPGFAVIAGFSGAPVWDEQLQGVVGMIVASSQPSTTKTAFAIPFDVLVAAWPPLADIMRPRIPRNPYKGLHAFTELDSRDFFGRDTLINELATAVETALTRESKEGQQARLLTVVLGPSGSGKSSVVMAGLLPCLRDGRVLNSKEWVYLDPVFPGTHPLEALAVSLAKQLPARGPISLHEDLKAPSERNLHLLARQIASLPQQKVVLLVDQFEEVFTLTTDEAERRHFFELLVTAVTEPRGPLLVILTLRADFYDRPMQYPELYRLIDNHHVSVLPLEREELRKVIEKPANLPDVQVTFENGLVDELLFDMQGQSGALPLLEFTLDQLFQRRNGHQLTLQAYHGMGGVTGALSKHAEETYLALPSDAQRQAARDIFLRLIEPGATEQDTTRRRADRSEFERADPMQAQQMRESLEAFISARLLTTNQVGGQTTVEVSHEALIREWKRLADWLHEARDDILLQQVISEDAAGWVQHNKPLDRLYRGTQLAEAQAWAMRHVASTDETAFLQASVTESERQEAYELLLQRRDVRRQRYIIGLMAGISLVLIAGLIISLILSGQLQTTLSDLQKTVPVSVTNLQDHGPGSLRSAVENARSGSIITFARNLTGTIRLTSGAIVISKNLAINGPGATSLTISGNNATQVFVVRPNAVVTLSNVAITHGYDHVFGGGGIANAGVLTLINCIVSNNTLQDVSNSLHGGGILNSGGLTLVNTTVSRNTVKTAGSAYGGGILNYRLGTLTLINSTVSENEVEGDSAAGGGIVNLATLTLSRSTVENNVANSSALASGGGIMNFRTLTLDQSTVLGNTVSSSTQDGLGGGIIDYSAASTAILTNSTITLNAAQGKGGGIAAFASRSVFIMYSTLYENKATFGGGVYIEGNNPNGTTNAVTLEASIVAGNTAERGPDIFGTLTLLDPSLIEHVPDPDTSLIYGTDPQDPSAYTLAKRSIFGSSPKLGSLQTNGASTPFYPLLPDSPAIDQIPLNNAGECDVTSVFAATPDQRGIKRPQGKGCDLGAYESSY